MSEEGSIQVFKTEYDCDVHLEGGQYTGAHWITAATPAKLREFTSCYLQRMVPYSPGTLAYLRT